MPLKNITNLLKATHIPVNPILVERRNSFIGNTKLRIPKSVVGKCVSCEEDDVDVYYTAKAKSDTWCAHCVVLGQSYTYDKKTTRLSDQTNSMAVITEHGAEIVTAIPRFALGIPDGEKQVVVHSSAGFDKRSFFLKLLRNPPEKYAVVVFPNSTLTAKDIKLNVDHQRMTISGPVGIKINKTTKVTSVNTKVVLTYFDAFRDNGINAKMANEYLTEKSKDAHSSVAIVEQVEAVIPALVGKRVIHPESDDAKMVIYLLAAKVDKAIDNA